MSGPLSVLGETLLRGTEQYAANKKSDEDHARARAELIADEERRRGYQVADRADERSYEQKLYNDRRYDALKGQLIKDGYLKIGDADKPDAVTAALQKGGIEYSRSIDELAGYKAALPKLIEVTGAVPGVDELMKLTPDQIGRAREIMQSLTLSLGKRVQDDHDRGVNNAKNGGALLSVAMAQQNALSHKSDEVSTEIDKLQNGEPLDPASQQQARNLAMSMHPELAKKKALAPSEIAQITAEAAKHEEDIRVTKVFQLTRQLRELQGQAKNLNQQFDNIASNVKAGAYAFVDQASLGLPGAAGATPVAPKVAPTTAPAKPAASTDSFLDAISGKKPSAAAPTAPAGPRFADTFNDPVILQANARTADTQKALAQSKLDSLQQEIQSTDQQIRGGGINPVPFSPAMAGLGYDAMSAARNPDTQAQGLVDLHRRRAILQSQYDQLKAQLMGQAPVTSAPPDFSQATLGIQ